MKKEIKISIVILLLSASSFAQQLPLYSNYMLNKFIINPAVAGTQDYFMVATNNRYQWVGVTDAPRTHILSVNGPHRTKSIGFGGAVFSDVTGPTSRTGAYFAYAYHFKIKENAKLSLGLSGGILQYKVDGTQITLKDAGDFSLMNSVQSAIVPDFGFGAYYYTEKFYVGLSVPQFIQNRLNFFETSAQSLSRLTGHYYINAGNKFRVANDWEVEPSILLKWAPPSIPQLDLGAKVTYQNYLWAGISLRTQDAFSTMLGYRTKNDKLVFAYAYDQPITRIRKYSYGTHEIMIAAKFANIKSGDELDALNSSENEVLAQSESQENIDNKKYTEEEKRAAALLAKQQKDKTLRNEVRRLRAEAEASGLQPNDFRFNKQQDYTAAINAIKSNYLEMEKLKSNN
ncbi:MAG: type IX secretion system membrane protein PorP/SprF [Flavobacteriales bacterium]